MGARWRGTPITARSRRQGVNKGFPEEGMSGLDLEEEPSEGHGRKRVIQIEGIATQRARIKSENSAL